MSAPNNHPGRQSPEPECQTGPQQQDIPGSGKTVPEHAPSSDKYAQEKSEQAKARLESNPVHPLDARAEAAGSNNYKKWK